MKTSCRRNTGNASLCIALLIVFNMCGLTALCEEITTWEPPKPPDNGALIYYRAFLVLNPLSAESDKQADEAFTRLTQDGVYDDSALSAWLASNQDALTLFLQAARATQCDFGVQFDQGPNALLPELARARNLARLGITALAQSLYSGHKARAVDYFDATIALAASVSRQGTVIGSLVAATIIEMIYRQAPALLKELNGQTALLERIAVALEDARPVLTDLSGAFDGEIKLHAALFPAPGSIRTWEDFHGFSMMIKFLGETSPEARAFQGLLSGDNAAQNREIAAAYLNCGAEELTTPQGMGEAAARKGAALMQTLTRMKALALLPYTQAAPQFDALIADSQTDPLNSTFIAALGGLCFHRAKLQTRLDMLRTAVILLQRREADGELPQTLPADVPADPFTDGEAFAYQRLVPHGFTLTGKGVEKQGSEQPLSLSLQLDE